MKERLFTLLAVLALLITGLQPVLPSVPFAGSITPLAECQDGGVCAVTAHPQLPGVTAEAVTPAAPT